MRGEDGQAEDEPGGGRGSPPHARGRHRPPDFLKGPVGITPACAGKTPDHRRRVQPGADHPRMRGEDPSSPSPAAGALGSPPHARGRRGLPKNVFVAGRITPACAGKTSCVLRKKSGSPDHPRMRGEDPSGRCGHAVISGSPPHARGRPERQPVPLVVKGITPACAGKTGRGTVREPSAPDHPRMRGEDAEKVFDFLPEPWITPACAGKTVGFPRESGKIISQFTSFLLLLT